MQHQFPVPTVQEIEQHYLAMISSVDLINAVIAGTQMQDDTEQQKKDCVDRNVRHLQVMKTQTFWTTEGMTSVDAAIAAGMAYM